MQVEQVQRWIMSALVLTICCLLATGLALLADRNDRAGARPGLLIIAGLIGVFAMIGVRAINLKRILTPWLLLGLLPAAVGFWFLYLR